MTDLLAGRDALHDNDATTSRAAFEGAATGRPLVTIAVPTFRRPDMLVETVRSALSLRFDRPVEILVVDNDPEGSADRLLAALPELRDSHFRYMVNAANIGMFGNWNRCLTLARGEWTTILNDDDLLDPDYLRAMFCVLDEQRHIDGIVCRKRYLDQRQAATRPPSTVRRLAARLWLELRWRGRASRRFPIAHFFWGNVIGNTAGFLCRTAAARAIGGFLPEEYPSADYLFYLRFVQAHCLHQHRALSAVVRVADNESAKRETLLGFLRWDRRVQAALIGRHVGQWRRWLVPLLLERHRTSLSGFWRQDLPKDEVGRVLDMRLPRDRPRLLSTLRALLGEY